MLTKEEALEQLKKDYTNPAKPIGFAGISAIYKYFKGVLPVKAIKAFLNSRYVYTRHREWKKPYRKNCIFSYAPRQIVEIDLLQFSPQLARANQNHHFLLVAIDIFTRYVFARFVRTKAAQDIVPAFESILKEMAYKSKVPSVIVADRGLEWRNKHFLALMDRHKIELRHNFSSYHSSYVV